MGRTFDAVFTIGMAGCLFYLMMAGNGGKGAPPQVEDRTEYDRKYARCRRLEWLTGTNFEDAKGVFEKCMREDDN